MPFFDKLMTRRGSTDSQIKFVSCTLNDIVAYPRLDEQQFVEEWDATNRHLLHGAPMESLDIVEILAPLRGRDVICVGKNYREHAEEFHNSGFDHSDHKAQPDFTSIIGTNQEIYHHPKITQTLDYEGELGIISRKAGIQISREHAWDYVWGATIIND
ncbi:uncharacterized protein IAS62_001530 [Cryptococcus decagattii]|uniref:Fumarylacetoacetase-like C-terminal domain-containing protein n=1 Tax=Cryptococcus decagattii TaxID=1859122 RepID=A0ABZ2AS02_9TREE